MKAKGETMSESLLNLIRDMGIAHYMSHESFCDTSHWNDEFQEKYNRAIDIIRQHTVNEEKVTAITDIIEHEIGHQQGAENAARAIVDEIPSFTSGSHLKIDYATSAYHLMTFHKDGKEAYFNIEDGKLGFGGDLPLDDAATLFVERVKELMPQIIAQKMQTTPISIQAEGECIQTGEISYIEVDNIMHQMNLDRPDIATLPEGATISVNITTHRKAADLIKRLAAREPVSVDIESIQKEYYKRGWKDAEEHYAEYEGKPHV